jgi:hypothetical protein
MKLIKSYNLNKGGFVNPFDEVARVQKEMREQASFYRFFIYEGFVTDIDECARLYCWFDDCWSTKDPEGVTRRWLLRKIPDFKVYQIVKFEKLKKQPENLRSYIHERLGIEKS